MRRLLDDFAAIFDLSYRAGGRTLEERISDLLDTIDASSAPDWGKLGSRQKITSMESSALRFYYLPHLFPEMGDTLRLAHKLQFGLLPIDLPENSFISISAVLESYCHLSGDLFGWEGLSDGDFFIWMFDVAGHGVGSGAASAVVRTLIEAEPERDDPAMLAANLNEAICDCLRSHINSFYATALFMRIRRDGTALYTSAGHQPFLVARAGGTIDSFEPTGIPIGMLRESSFESIPLELAPGDNFLLFTDGVTELANDFDEHFGMKRLTEFLKSGLETPGEITDGLHSTLREFSNLDFLSDDLAFVAGTLKG
jgi:sigma-B regulation protein RsbU (phosphoserine phosphatase)